MPITMKSIIRMVVVVGTNGEVVALVEKEN